MKKINYVIFGLFFLLTAPLYGMDSLRVEVNKGKWVIVHKVDEGETLFSISQRYDAEIDAITTHNDISDYLISVGQTLYIPYPEAGETAYHTVVKGETLFSISRKYNYEVAQIRKWNNMDSYSISEGQKLLIYLPPGETAPAPAVSEPQVEEEPVITQKAAPTAREGYHIVASGETLYSISTQYGITVEELRKWNELDFIDLVPGQELLVVNPSKEEEVEETVAVGAAVTEVEDPETEMQLAEYSELAAMPKVELPNKVTDSGLAELIEGSSDSGKFLALHKNAPIGTVLAVENELNHQVVFVRVIGQIPNTGGNDQVVVKISRAAYEQLGAVNTRFRVLVSYLK